MEKIKSLLSPGKQTDDEIMYGSSGTPDQSHQKAGLSGEGSHFDQAGSTQQGSSQPVFEPTTDPVTAQPFRSEGNFSASHDEPHRTQGDSGYRQDNYSSSQDPYASQNTGVRQDNLASQQEPYTSQGSTGLRQENYISQPETYTSQGNVGSRQEDYTSRQEPYTSGGSTSTHHDARTSNRDDTSGSSSKPKRQEMPGKYPTGDSVKETVHNPYTTHALDPRIGGGTQESTRNTAELGGSQGTSGRSTGNQQTQYQAGSNTSSGAYNNQEAQSGEHLKGLNVARTENYAQDDRNTGQSTSDSNYGRNAAIGAGGIALGGGAVAVERHLHDSDRPTSEALDRSNEYSGTTSSGNNDNYYGAPTGTAVSGSQQTGTGNIAAPAYSQQSRDQTYQSEQYPTSTQQQGYSTDQYPSGSQAGQQAYQSEQYPTSTQQQGYSTDQYSSGAQSGQQVNASDYPYDLRKNEGSTEQYTTQNYDADNKHHTLRNTAIGAGVAGVGAHEYREHRERNDNQYDNYSGNNNNVYDQNTTTGRHGADTVRDTEGRDRFYGKEAAMAGTGGVAYTEIAGTGAAQSGTRHKPYTESEPVSGHHDRTGASGPASNTSGPHKSNLLNKLDPRVDENYAATATTGSRGVAAHQGASDGHESVSGYDRHGSRQAVAGAGMPLGNDEATTRYTEHAHGLDDSAYAKTTGTTGHGSHATTGKHIPLDGVELPRGNQYGQDVKDPRYGLPMSAAGITAAEAEALRAHDDDLMAKHAANDEKHHHTKDTTHGTTEKKKRRSSILGFLHRDKNKKYSKEEEEEFSRQEREHNARSGLTGAAVAGSAGHNTGYETNKPLPPNPTHQIRGEQMDLTDRTRQANTTTAPAYTGGMVDSRGNSLEGNRNTTSTVGTAGTTGSEIPASEYIGRDSGVTSSAYAGDGRDYPAGGYSSTSNNPQYGASNTVGDDGIHTKVAEVDGHNVLHKKSHVIHPAAVQENESAYQEGAKY